MINALPLEWPLNFPRSSRRELGKFKASLAAALKNVQDSIRLFGSDSGKKVEGLVISSNFSLGVSKPADSGVSVWFRWDGLQVCIPVDRYSSVEANLQAIHHIVEARRVELRHGTLALVRASFTGFAALPSPGRTHARSWRDVLNIAPDSNLETAKTAYRRLSTERHPDRGGTNDAMSELNWAWAQAQEALGEHK